MITDEALLIVFGFCAWLCVAVLLNGAILLSILWQLWQFKKINQIAPLQQQDTTVDEPALDGQGQPIKDRNGQYVSRRTVCKTTPIEDEIAMPPEPEVKPTKLDSRAL